MRDMELDQWMKTNSTGGAGNHVARTTGPAWEICQTAMPLADGAFVSLRDHA